VKAVFSDEMLKLRDRGGAYVIRGDGYSGKGSQVTPLRRRD
jgi:hypothetical protein